MDRVTLDDLKSLALHEASPCVSIYMPLHRAVGDALQDAVCLRNLLDRVESRLNSDGMRGPDTKNFLREARELSENTSYWKPNSGAGLCVLIGPGFFRRLRLPFGCAESMRIGSRFHLGPLAHCLARDDRFLLFAVSMNSVRLFECRHGALSPVALPEAMPKSLDQALAGTEIERTYQHHTAAAKSVQGTRTDIMHGHGDPKDDQKVLIAEYFRILAKHLEGVLKNDHAPLVVAAVNYLHPMFRAACRYPHILETGVAGSPDELTEQEMLAKARPLIEPLVNRRISQASERYRNMLGSDRINRHIEKILPAADQGRVEVLFAALGAPVWGRFDKATGDVMTHPTEQSGDLDLLDESVRSVLKTGGEVYVVASEDVPDKGPSAAIFRW